MSKQTNEEKKESKPYSYGGVQPETVHCRRCKTVMENGVCPTCGFKIYVPMDEQKRKKIKAVGTAIGFAVFIVLFVVMQFMKN